MKVLRILAFPISILYALVVHIRNFLFDTGIFKSKEFRTPTICVGNLSAGGTGKTPMIEYLIKMLKTTNEVAVLSRGYGRKSVGYHSTESNLTVEELGDEPFQIHAKYPDILVAVDADRRNGIAIIEKSSNVDVILLDDAFQHRKVKPTLAILLTSYGKLYCNDWYLPTGNLRDSKREAKRANILIVTKCPENLSELDKKNIISDLKPKLNQKVLFSFLHYQQQLIGGPAKLSLTEIKNKKITLVTGIANPKPLVTFLNSEGISFEHLNFSDHHFFSNKEIEHFNTKEFILTTEKDFVRLKGRVENMYYIAITHQFLDDGAEVLAQQINQILKQ